jgi:hypothetical protein
VSAIPTVLLKIGTPMLQESYGRKYSDERRRRWFSDEDCDLIIWSGHDGAISGFQLCYDKQTSERALTWRREVGFSHERVDSGETNPAKNQSPVLVPDGLCPIAKITEQFLSQSKKIDPIIRYFVATKLREYRGTV